MKNWVIFILLCTSIPSLGQDIPLNTWRSHFNYSEARIIEQADQTIFCATTNALFIADLTSRSIQKINKEHGLGDTRISAMHYVDEMSIMILGYESGIIDLLESNGTITTISTLRDAQIVASKSIHSISSIGQKVYLATNFGVVFFDLSSKSVKENYRNIGSNGLELIVQEILVRNDSIYISAEDGIRAGRLSDNLLDFNAWTHFPETSAGGFEHLISAETNLYVTKDSQNLWEYNGSTWVDMSVAIPASATSVYYDDDDDELVALTPSGVYSLLPSPVELLSDPLLKAGNDLIVRNSDYWIADAENGLLSIGATSDQLLPNGPLKEIPSTLKWVGGRTYAFFGPQPETYDGTSDNLGYSVFDNGQWKQTTLPNFYNLSGIAAIGSSLYFTSIGFGLYDQQRDVILDETNSNLTTSSNFSDVQLSAIQSFDNSVWMLGYDSQNSIYELSTDGAINSFSSEKLGSRFPLDLDISSEGVLWAIRGSNEGGGIATFDPTLDLQRTIGTLDNLPSSTVTGIAINPNDEAWISTKSGVANFSSASFPFVDFDVYLPILQGGFSFEDQKINDILTDGGGRIWLATDAGVWVLAKDLTSIVHAFSVDNSPLPSDNVLQFSYNENNGEVFILTDKGLVSYRSVSSKAEDVHESQIGIFPNPVLPGYVGVVGFTGLVRDANIKITDTRGRLVQEITAHGGVASWNLRTFNQAPVKSGVYLVLSSSVDGTETLVGKLAIIK